MGTVINTVNKVFLNHALFMHKGQDFGCASKNKPHITFLPICIKEA